LYACLEKLAELVELARLSQSEKERACMRRTIHLVGRALRTVAWAYHWIGAAEQRTKGWDRGIALMDREDC
jgi:hypothetical protein